MPRYLTLRQDQVLRLVAEGLTNEQIAAHYGIGVATVQRHIEDIRAALGATNRANAVWQAVRHGFLDPHEEVSRA